MPSPRSSIYAPQACLVMVLTAWSFLEGNFFDALHTCHQHVEHPLYRLIVAYAVGIELCFPVRISRSIQNDIAPWNLSAVSEVTSVSPNWTPRFKVSSIWAGPGSTSSTASFSSSSVGL